MFWWQRMPGHFRSAAVLDLSPHTLEIVPPNILVDAPLELIPLLAR